MSKLRIVVDIKTDPNKGWFFDGWHMPPFANEEHIHGWLIDPNHVADAIHEAFEFSKKDYVSAKVSVIEI
tara:strand:+ start:210 stop:419 length:210 start_codon:yes stop_codon:yes gene_type:complete